MDSQAAMVLAAAAIEADAERGALDVAAIAPRFHRLQDALEAAVHRDASLRPPVEIHKGAQSKHFMAQLLPYIHGFMSASPRGTTFTILDVGPGTGHGANFLGSLYAVPDLGYRAQVSTLDTNRVYEPYMRVFCRWVTPRIDNVFAHRDTYDIVIASHVVEHVQQSPVDFVRRLQQLARGIVIVCAPYAEPADQLSQGHLHSLADEFLAAIEPESVDLVESPAWGWFMEPRYRMFVAVLRGSAQGHE